jgi:hypothetical protein
MEDRLLFLISSPRSGSTMLARSLGAHSQILGTPELHLLTPLAHLGFYARVDTAPYDPVVSQEAMRELVSRLPEGEADYMAACRAYTDHLYGRLLRARDGKRILLEQTPAYALVIPFIVKLYPGARYVVLTRNPLAILSSYANSFFDGSYEEALRFNPVLDRYVPAIARFLRERPAPLVHVRYEELVANSRADMERILDLVGLPFEEATLRYGEDREGEQQFATSRRGLGDPTGVAQHIRPVTASVEKWAREIASDPAKRSLAIAALDGLEDADLETWGYPRAEILRTLEGGAGRGAPHARAPLTRYRLERRLLVRARRLVHRSTLLRRLLERTRLYSEVLLR